MRETQSRAKEALAIIANQRTALARGVSNPDAYHASVLRDVRAQHWDQALAIAETDHALSPADIVDALVGPAVPPPPSPGSGLPRDRTKHACRTCGCYGGGGWLDTNRGHDGTIGIATPCPECAPERHHMHERWTA